MAIDFGNDIDVITIAVPGGLQDASIIEIIAPGPQGPAGPMGPPGDGELVNDHGLLAGLSDDDHPQYFNITRGDARYSLTSHTHPGGEAGVSDHGALSGLLDDDHPQYHTDARGDLRYALISHDHTSDEISDSTTTGRALLTAPSAAAARTSIGAGTSSLVIGTTSSSAKAGDYQPSSANISDSTAVGRSLITAVSAASARSIIGAGTSDLVLGTTSTTAKAGDYQPTAANISDSTTVGRALVTAADAAAARAAISAISTSDSRLTDARTPTDASVTNAKVATGAAISADKLADGTTNVIMLATERTKLAGVATGATANDTDANLKNRANHTGTQLASTISDLSTAVQGIVYPTGYLSTPDVVSEFPITTALEPAGLNLLYNPSYLIWPHGYTSIAIPAGNDAFTAGGWIGASHEGPSTTASQADPYKGGITSVMSFTAVTQYHYVRQLVPNVIQFSRAAFYTLIADVTTSGTIAMDAYVQARVNTVDGDRELVIDSNSITLTGAGRRYVAVTFDIPDLWDNVQTWDERNMMEVAWRFISTTAATRTCTIHSMGLIPGRVAKKPTASLPAVDRAAIESYYESGFVQVAGLTSTSGQKRAAANYHTRKELSVALADITITDLAGNVGKVSTYDLAGVRTDNVAYTAIQGDTTSNPYQNGFTVVINGSTASGIGYLWTVNNY